MYNVFMKVLITGGAGFLGSHLVDRLLQKKHSVIVVDNLSVGKKEFLKPHFKNKNFTFIRADVSDYKNNLKIFSKSIHTIFHLAANSNIQKGVESPEVDFDQTIQTTFSVLQAMRVRSIKRIFFTSGSGVYGDVGSKRVKESYGPLLPASMYGATKLSAEAMIGAFVNLYDMQGWIVRPANIVGSRLTHGVLYDFIKNLKKHPDKLLILGNGRQSKSYLHVNHVVDAIFTIWKKANERVSIFNLSSSDSITVNEIAQIIIEKMNLRDVKISYSGGHGGWRGDVPIVKLDSRKLRDLGWRARLNSRQTISKAVSENLESLTL